MILSVIAAITRDNALGKDGDLLYRISADQKRFKALTMGHPIIMGRLTYESLGGRTLPGRLNIVITRQPDYSAPGALVVGSLQEAVEAVKAQKAEKAEEVAYVLGGGQIYREAMSIADRLDLTIIEVERPDADTFFPQISSDDWRCDDPGTTVHDPRNDVDYRFACFSRR